MFADVVLHWMLDMSGAVTFWWIVSRAAEAHTGFGRVVAARPWTTQMITAFIVAYVTVHLVG